MTVPTLSDVAALSSATLTTHDVTFRSRDDATMTSSGWMNADLPMGTSSGPRDPCTWPEVIKNANKNHRTERDIATWTFPPKKTSKNSVIFVILRLAVLVELRVVTDRHRQTQTDTDTGPWLASRGKKTFWTELTPFVLSHNTGF